MSLTTARPAEKRNVGAHARALLAAGRVADAEALARAALAARPDRADRHALLASIQRMTGRTDAATRSSRREIVLEPGRFSGHANAASATLDQNREAARPHACRAAILAPGDPRVWRLVSGALEGGDDRPATIRALRRLLLLTPAAPTGQADLSEALLATGAPDGLAAAHRARIVAPAAARPRRMLAAALMQASNYGDARPHARVAVLLTPDRSGLLADLAICIARTGPRGLAEIPFRRALTAYPGHRPAWTGLATILRDDGRLTAGAMALRAALLQEPGDARGMSNLAIILRDLAKDTAATTAFRRAHVLGPADPVVCANLAIQAYLDGDAAAAHRWSKVVDPDRARGRNRDFVAGYARLIAALSSHPRPGADTGAPRVHLVGDSHCLSPAGHGIELRGTVHVVSPHLVVGAKAWHLGGPGTNAYKTSLAARLDRLASGDTVITCFGEIDTRLEEGIIPHAHRHGRPVESVARETVDGFVDHVVAATRARSLALILMGVPAPFTAARALPAKDAARWVEAVRAFNSRLAARAKAAGIAFLDLHAVTAGPDGTADGSLHIDDVHLHPRALVLAARRLA